MAHAARPHSPGPTDSYVNVPPFEDSRPPVDRSGSDTSSGPKEVVVTRSWKALAAHTVAQALYGIGTMLVGVAYAVEGLANVVFGTAAVAFGGYTFEECQELDRKWMRGPLNNVAQTAGSFIERVSTYFAEADKSE